MKTILTCAVTGGGAITERSQYVPITPEQIAVSALEAAQAGAAMVHIHVRNPETGVPAWETRLYREVIERIRERNTEVIVNLTGGVGGRYVPSEDDPAVGAAESNFLKPETRVAHILELKPDVCSLDVGSLNFGRYVVLNTPPHLTRMAALIKQAGVMPEIEVFDMGHIRYARHMIENGEIEGKPMFQLCLGIPWGADATAEVMTTMKHALPRDCHWGAFGISTAIWPMVAQAIILGGNVRVGLEDSLFINRGELATSNAVLVERAVDIIRNLGGEVASAQEGRAQLGLAQA